MHSIIFEGTTEERGRAPDALDPDLYGDATMNTLSRGDIVWVVTRTGDDRSVPALCGRLMVDRVEARRPGESKFPDNRADRTHRLIVTRDGSERCVPFPCLSIAAWDIWRRPFGGVLVLTHEQGRSLDGEWSREARLIR